MEKMTIKQLHESDRPREKMIRLGARCLTDAELLAILIGSGNDRQTAIQLAQEILAKMDNSLPRLAKCDIQELTGRWGAPAYMDGYRMEKILCEEFRQKFLQRPV